MRRRLKQLLIPTGAVLLLAAGWVVVTGWRIVRFSGRDEAQPADVAIVLGAAAYHMRPSPVLEERINHALNLYRNGLVSRLLFTGGYGPGAPMAESEVARRFAVAQGVNPDHILIETASHSTSGNIGEAIRLMDRYHLSSAVLVSDPLHMLRAVSMMRDRGVPVYSSPTPTSRYVSLSTKADFLLREIYFYTIYLITGK